MTTLLAIDPGPEKSGYAFTSDGELVTSGKIENLHLLVWLHTLPPDELAIEMIASYGMPVGQEVFETCVWIGRFIEASQKADGVKLVYRKEVKLHLCGNMRAKDANIRQALIDKYPATGGGKIPQIGTKAKPGPLYGIKRDAWSALAVAVTARELNL